MNSKRGTYTAPAEFSVREGCSYVATATGGTSTWQFFDGAAWIDFETQGSGIQFVAPGTGHVRINVTGGATQITLIEKVMS